MSIVLIIPGLHSSGPDHWQCWFESRLVPSRRVVQRDWRNPNLADWTQRLRREIHFASDRVFLVAHSFGALAAAQAGRDHLERIVGAMLVAPADPDNFGAADFLPKEPLGFPSIVVASENDPWMAIDRAAHWAGLWSAELINLGKAGHINAESGFGPWPDGLEIFARLRSLAGAPTQTVAIGANPAGGRFGDMQPSISVSAYRRSHAALPAPLTAAS